MISYTSFCDPELCWCPGGEAHSGDWHLQGGLLLRQGLHPDQVQLEEREGNIHGEECRDQDRQTARYILPIVPQHVMTCYQVTTTQQTTSSWGCPRGSRSCEMRRRRPSAPHLRHFIIFFSQTLSHSQIFQKLSSSYPGLEPLNILLSKQFLTLLLSSMRLWHYKDIIW